LRHWRTCWPTWIGTSGADLPEPQRIAVDRVLLREQTADGGTDQRAVAAAFLAVVDRLSDDGPLLLAISSDFISWLHLPRPDAIQRISVLPWASRELHSVVRDKLGHPIRRTAMARIHRLSAGNPFYAIELARALTESADEMLPATLAELVRARIGSLDPAVHDVLLAAACLGSRPTMTD
jgi:hypothetical protein